MSRAPTDTDGTYPFDTPRRTAFGYGPHDRPAGQAAKSAWAAVVAQAGRLAGDALETNGAAPSREAGPAFVAAVRAAGEQPFPTPHTVARSAATGFIFWARAMCSAARPADRIALAPTLKAAAQALDRYLDEEREAAARVWQRQLPGGDRDV